MTLDATTVAMITVVWLHGLLIGYTLWGQK